MISIDSPITDPWRGGASLVNNYYFDSHVWIQSIWTCILLGSGQQFIRGRGNGPTSLFHFWATDVVVNSLFFLFFFAFLLFIILKHLLEIHFLCFYESTLILWLLLERQKIVKNLFWNRLIGPFKESPNHIFHFQKWKPISYLAWIYRS